jgi:D-beta-D-heptose 7-phosphate kinase/D-beta-D-heptose 1-phosphate adenosyltransferase
LDRYMHGDTSRVSPEAPVPVVRVTKTDERPGGAANVAVNIKSLGTSAHLLGIVGDDAMGAALQAQLAMLDITSELLVSAKAPTIVKLRVLSRNQQLLRLDFEQSYCEAALEDQLYARFCAHLPQVQLVIISDYLKGTLTNPQRFIAAAKQHGVTVLVDPKARDVGIYQGASWLTPNWQEFEAMVGPCATEDQLVTKGRELMAQQDIGTLLITRSEQGMTLLQQEGVYHLPAEAHEVFDVTGAGDTVISTLGAALAAGAAPLPAVRWANLAASLAVTKLGAVAISVPKLVQHSMQRAPLPRGIMQRDALIPWVKRLQTAGKRIVFTNGCYDVIHAGHVQSLSMAKALGDYLIVAVNSDASVKRLKGAARPLNPIAHRLAVLAGFEAVDWVLAFDEDTPIDLLHALQPNVLVKGGDYTIDAVVGKDVVEAYGGTVTVVQHGIQTSSTALLQQLYEEKQLVFANDQTGG